MKFKSNLKSEAPVDFSALEQDINTLLNVDLSEATENLDDLVLLYANIAKYGITEPVMDLIGGTLESWNISIQNKEACLEGLGETIKNAGRNVWEMILKIYRKISDFIKSLISKKTKDDLENDKKILDENKLGTTKLKSDSKDKDASGIIPKNNMKDVEWFVRSMIKETRIFRLGFTAEVNRDFLVFEENKTVIKENILSAIDDTNMSKKGYSDAKSLLDADWSIVESIESLSRYMDKTIDDIDYMEKNGTTDHDLYKVYKDDAQLISTIIRICHRHLNASRRIRHDIMKESQSTERV